MQRPPAFRPCLRTAGVLWTLVLCVPAPVFSEEANPLLKTFVDEFVAITPGEGAFPASFRQGSGAEPSERPVRDVTFARPFQIARYEVPQNLYELVMEQNPSRWKGPRNSAERMTWGEAVEFCERATRLLREAKLIGDDEVIRLPTESEWEYCCRAGTTTAYSFGDSAQKEGDADARATILDAYAWHTGNAAGNDPAVGSLKPNAWGLYDMHGYLWEYCQDEWRADYEGAPTDGRAAADREAEPKQRVIRGGSWKDPFAALRSSSRRPFDVAARDDAVGFRCVRSRQ
ncbi:MAG: formylglycine-generating enzyme family protein [Planctomyces sp.]|nr:formylglycine-generating enzyme family protein [Planctomyces sp.]